MLKEAETANTSEIGLDQPLGRGCRRHSQRRLSDSSSNSENGELSTKRKSPKKRKKSAGKVQFSTTLPTLPQLPSIEKVIF